MGSLRGLFRLLFQRSGPRRAEAEALDEERTIAATEVGISKLRHEKAVRALLDETIDMLQERHRGDRHGKFLGPF